MNRFEAVVTNYQYSAEDLFPLEPGAVETRLRDAVSKLENLISLLPAFENEIVTRATELLDWAQELAEQTADALEILHDVIGPAGRAGAHLRLGYTGFR